MTDIFGSGALVIERSVVRNIKAMEPISPWDETLSSPVCELRESGRLKNPLD